MASMAEIDQTDNATTTVATNVLHDKEGADKEDLAVTPATAPFFRLPRELRDEVYDLVALSARTTYYDITLEANKQPEKIAYVIRGGSQFEIECAAAAERRIRSLLVAGDRSGLVLSSPEAPQHVKNRDKQVKAEQHWHEVSQGKCAGGYNGRNIHALILVVPLVTKANSSRFRYPSTVMFTFRFSGKEELGPRRRVDAYWHHDIRRLQDSRRLIFPSVGGSAVQELLKIAQKVVWTGSFREYMIWQRYIAALRRGVCAQGHSPKILNHQCDQESQRTEAHRESDLALARTTRQLV
ncbi:hypothetical protein Q7P35_001862 [Cladosporium inversicolor]